MVMKLADRIFRPCSLSTPLPFSGTCLLLQNNMKMSSSTISTSLTHQNLPHLANSSIEKTVMGGYVVVDTNKPIDVVFVSSGSEVA